MPKIFKKTVDVPSELYEDIMKYAYENKIYKFSPAVVEILHNALLREKLFNATRLEEEQDV